MRRRLSLLLAGLITLGATLTLTTSPAAATGPRTLTAHRGITGVASQRTGIAEGGLRALRWANSRGAQILDVDVVLTTESDGRHFMAVSHDRTTDRVTNCSGTIYRHSLAWFKRCLLELPDGTNTTEHAVSLNQVLEWFATTPQPTQLALETKGRGWSQAQVSRLKGVLRDHGVLDRVIFHSFQPQTLTYAKAARIPHRGLVVGSTPLPTPATVKRLGSWLYVKRSLASPAYVAGMRAHGVKVGLYTMTTPAQFEAAYSLGPVDTWVVDDLVGAQQWLGAR
jgi:glycerophosphoryl diester phosphodiesterase